MSNLLTRIVTPAFIAFQAHCWFAYAFVYTLYCHEIVVAALIIAAVKEFYIDKHFELSQSFADNLQDFAGYATGVAIAIGMHRWLS